MITIDKDCYGTIAIAWAICLAIGALVYFCIDPMWLKICLLTILLVFMCFVTWFHRIPVRTTVGNDTTVCSVADGKVIIVDEVYEPEYFQAPRLKVSIYMNFFDVHANFWPLTGEISYYKYHPGRYLLAFHPKSSDLNEHSSTVIRNFEGKELLFKQIAGTFARRIVCYSKENLPTVAGEQCGIIKFGSRIDMYLPLDARIEVKVGDKVRASETVIARL